MSSTECVDATKRALPALALFTPSCLPGWLLGLERLGGWLDSRSRSSTVCMYVCVYVGR